LELLDRDPELKYPVAIKKEKTTIVLSWLVEFRFSTIEIMAARIGQTSQQGVRFFNSLISDGFIRQFKNSMIPTRLFMLTPKGGEMISMLLSREVNVHTRVSTYGRSTKLAHDLAVQKMALKFISGIDGIVWDNNIVGELDIPPHTRPDALMHSRNNFWWALELERTRKAKARIFFAYYNHIQNMRDGHYKGVRYIFNNEAVCKYYQGVFNEPVWPMYSRNPKTGRLVQVRNNFDTQSLAGIAKTFIFEVREYW
jgi:hypothetical protein